MSSIMSKMRLALQGLLLIVMFCLVSWPLYTFVLHDFIKNPFGHRCYEPLCFREGVIPVNYVSPRAGGGGSTVYHCVYHTTPSEISYQFLAPDSSIKIIASWLLSVGALALWCLVIPGSLVMEVFKRIEALESGAWHESLLKQGVICLGSSDQRLLESGTRRVIS